MDNSSQSADIHLAPLLRSRGERYLAERDVREAILSNDGTAEDAAALQRARDVLAQKAAAERASNRHFNATLGQMAPRFHVFRQARRAELPLEYHAICDLQYRGDPRDFPVRKEMLIGRPQGH